MGPIREPWPSALSLLVRWETLQENIVTLPKKASPLDFRILYINVWILYREIELNQSSSRDTEVTFASHVP